MISLQTNVDSINAQENLNIDHNFQSKTIQQLTTGFRINSSADDAAGLAIANGYRSNIAELHQGVSNANDGVSQLQIVDGGLGNISTILDRLKTLATQSASQTFTGNRSVLNKEYSGLLSEIDRQANNINLNVNGTLNNKLNVYIGGASTASSANISIDLSGSKNAVDSGSLGLSATNVNAGGVGVSGNTQRLDAPGATFLGTVAQTFTVHAYAGSGATTLSVSVGGSGALTSDQVLSSLNSQLSSAGITAGLDSNGALQFSGGTAFTINAPTSAATDGILTGAGTASNTSNYTVGGAASSGFTAAQTLTFQTSNGSASVSLATTDNVDSAIGKINAQTASKGVFAVLNAAGTGISFQGSSSFSVDSTQTAAGIFAGTANTSNTSTAPTSSNGSNATSAIAAINSAIQSLGLVQGSVGAGENKLQYAISLAQSQISNFSAAQSQIRDADIAQQAANLTKSQVLQQTSIAAMAQANSEPQSVLKLLQ